MNIEFIRQCIRDDDMHKFYCRKEWITLRDYVMKLDKNECQKCKARNIVKAAVLVHHVHHVRDYPELALSIFDAAGKRNLISLCQTCHEEEHPDERHKFRRKEGTYTNEEQW